MKGAEAIWDAHFTKQRRADEVEAATLRHAIIEQAKAWQKDSVLPWSTLLDDAAAERLPAARWKWNITQANGAWHLEVKRR